MLKGMIYGEPNIILADVSNAYDDSKIPVILLDRTFSPVYYNRAATTVYKYLVTSDFLNRHLSDDEKSRVAAGLRDAAFFRLIPANTTVFKAFIFSLVFDSKGNRLPFIKFQAEEAYSSEDFLNTEFSGGKLASIIASSLLRPIGVMSSVVELLEKRIGDEKSKLYLESIGENAFLLERGVSRIAAIYSTFASYGHFNVSAFDPVPFLCALSAELKTEFSTETEEHSTLVFLDKDAFRKSFLDIYCYVSGLRSAFKTKHPITTRLCEEKHFFVAEVSRRGVLRSDINENDAFSFSLDENGEIKDTLAFAKRIFETAGGELKIETDGRGKSVTATVRVALPTALPEKDTLGSERKEFIDFRNIYYRAFIDKIKRNTDN